MDILNERALVASSGGWRHFVPVSTVLLSQSLRTQKSARNLRQEESRE